MDSFRDLLNVEELGDKKVNFNDQRGDISYYCKDCKEIVEVERIEPKGFVFECKKCEGKNIVLGTLSGLKENYRLK